VTDLKPVGAGPVMTIMILYAQDSEVFVNGVRRVLVDVVKMKADALPFADTTAVCVCLQEALPVRIAWIRAAHIGIRYWTVSLISGAAGSGLNP
jgi:hypothetical protein